MHRFIYFGLISTALFTTATVSKSFLPDFLSRSSDSSAQNRQQQQPLMNIPIPIPGSSGDKDGSGTGSDDLSIADVIGKERTINIFAGFTRDVDSISNRLDNQDKQTTVLAPLNSALKNLPRKPWEDPEDYNAMGAEAYKGSEGEDRATRNLRRFVEAHTIPVSPWKEGEKVQSVRGETLWWETKDGKKIIRPQNIEVDTIADKVGNGELWSLKGCLDYQA